MKKISLLLSSVFLLISCKKIYTCECTTTYTSMPRNNFYQTQSMSGSNTAYSEKMSNKQAKAACAHEQNSTETNFTNAITGDGSSPLKSGESISTSCDLK